MIEPEQVPQPVWLAMRDQMYNGIRNEATLIAAALNAWPGVFGTELEDHTGVYRRIILPLPREPRDDDWGKPVGKEEW